MSREKQQQSTVRAEMSLTILQAIKKFKSKQEPKYKITESDKLYVLSNLVTRELNNITI